MKSLTEQQIGAAVSLQLGSAASKRKDVSDLRRTFEDTVPEELRSEAMRVATEAVFGTAEKSKWNRPVGFEPTERHVG